MALGDALWERFDSSKDENLWYYRSLVEVLTAQGSSTLGEELRLVVDELERAARRPGSPNS